METADHITAIAREAELLAAAADRNGLDADIVWCPGWDMRELVRHLSEIHLWAAGIVAQRTAKLWPDDISDHTVSWPDLAVFWPDDDRLTAWYLETNANLVRSLESAPMDLECPTFLPAPSPRAMWARRQAHETAVHRFDAESAGGTLSEFDPVFAADGVDEILSAFAPRGRQFPVESPKTMVVHATDTDDRWHVTMAPGGIDTVRGDAPADVSLSGTASDLYLALWNRQDDFGVTVTGDRDVFDVWHENHRIRWT
jgi:uncharacterized protein (TIGR03083 family)